MECPRAVKAPDPSRNPGSDPPGPPRGTPDYIADICSGLIRLAEAGRHDMLAYLLGMARLEAESLRREAESRQRRSPDAARD